VGISLDLCIELGYALTSASLGAAGAWWLRGKLDRGGPRRAQPDTKLNREMLGKLYDVAAKVAADVGEHNTRVQEINDELTASNVHEAEAVVTAVTRLIQTNEQMQTQLAEAKERIRQQSQRLESSAAEARTDVLTGLANRRAFDEEIEQRRGLLVSENATASLLMIDVDHFKKFNDAYGHQAGDRVLHGLGGLLARNAREIDTAARYGGEEFGVILPGMTAEEAAEIAQQIRQDVAASKFRHSGVDLKVTISAGVAQLAAGEDATAWIGRADAALYASKQAGRNCVSLHDGRRIRTLDRGDAPVQAPVQAPPKAVAVSMPLPPRPKPPVEPKAAQPRPEKERRIPSGSAEKVAKVENSCTRTTFCMVLGQRLAERRRGGPPVSVLMLRVDDEDDIRSRFGQQGGELTARIVMQFLSASFREMDLVAQYQDDTFAALLPHCELSNVVEIAERLRQALARCRFPVAGEAFRFTVSIAGASAIEDDDTERLLARTEEALGAAVAAGGNCTFFHNGKTSEAAAVAADLAPTA
jgi:diguanylate cyclase